jgi:hypothetical protein
VDLFRQRKVSFIVYPWSEYTVPVCLERNEKDTAFLFMNDELEKVPGFKIRAFTQTLNPKKLEADERIAAHRILVLSEYSLLSDLYESAEAALKSNRNFASMDPSDLTAAAFRLEQWYSVLKTPNGLEKYFPHYHESLQALKTDWERLPAGKRWRAGEQIVPAISAARIKKDADAAGFDPRIFTMGKEIAEKYLWKCREGDQTVVKTRN